MRTVQAAPSAVAKGFNPQVQNPTDPWRRTMNYPRVWLWIANGLNLPAEQNYLLFVGAYVATFIGCIAVLLRKFPSLTLLMLAFSSSVLLCIERGNNDLVTFILIFLASFSVSSSLLTAILMLIAGLLKIYPAVAVLPLFRRRRDWVYPIAITACVALSLYGQVGVKSPVSTGIAYGIPSLAARFAQTQNIHMPLWLLAGIHLVIPLCVLFVFGVPKKIRAVYIEQQIGEVERRLFLSGALIYTFTFLAASNFDYRLIYLLLCVPYLLRLPHRALRAVVSALLVIASNYWLIQDPFNIWIKVNLIAKSLLFEMLVYLLLVEAWRHRPALLTKWMDGWPFFAIDTRK